MSARGIETENHDPGVVAAQVLAIGRCGTDVEIFDAHRAVGTVEICVGDDMKISTSRDNVLLLVADKVLLLVADKVLLLVADKGLGFVAGEPTGRVNICEIFTVNYAAGHADDFAQMGVARGIVVLEKRVGGWRCDFCLEGFGPEDEEVDERGKSDDVDEGAHGEVL